MEAYRFTYKQRREERDYFVTHVPAHALVPTEDGTCFTIDQLSPSNPDGYQRGPAEKRFKGFADFFCGVSNEGGFIGNPIPQPIVVNAREPLTVTLIEGCNSFAHIQIPKSLYIVDGQHRRGGIIRAITDMHADDDLRHHMVPLMIMNGLSREEEAVLFYVINHTMVKVPVDVAQRIAYQWTGVEGINNANVLRPWMPKAIELIDGLNGNKNSPWYKKVKTPGGNVRGGVSQGAFIRSLDMLLKTPKFGNAPVSQLTKLLITYWEIIKSLLPEAFENPRKYLIQKTTGLTVMNRLLPVIAEILQSQGKVTNPETLREVLTVLLEDGSDFWESRPSTRIKEPRAARYGTNNKGFSMLAEYLQEIRLNPLQGKTGTVFEMTPTSVESAAPTVTVTEETDEDEELPPPPTMPAITT